MSAIGGPHVCYVVYWGVAEPLGQSLVLPAISRLAEHGVRFTLISFEKPADLRHATEIARIRGELETRGVAWLPLVYHKRPKWPATAWDISHGALRALLARLRSRVDVVHARTFVAGPMGLAAARALGVPFVYHNEGFYPDEQVDGGVWQAGSLAHRVARLVEQFLYARADGIVTLSRRARTIVEGLPAVAARRTPVIVVPSAVDLDRFAPGVPRARRGSPLRLIYVGSVGARYLVDGIGAFVAALGRQQAVFLRVLSHSEPTLVERMLERGGLARDLWSVEFVPHALVPDELRSADAGLFFLTQGLSEHGCSPTKVGEYWACGLPVVTTANVSDTDEIVSRERVGVVVREHSVAGYERSAMELLSLLPDPGLGMRCRRAAETHYDVDAACDRIISLYRTLARSR